MACIPPDTLTSLDAIKMPGSRKELQQTLGLLVFWRKHIPDFSIIARPLYDLLRKGAKWEWGISQEEALQLLIFEATAHQALGPIHPTDPFQVEWGFAISGLSVHIWQRGPEGPTRPVGFYSRGFKDAEKRYTVWEKGQSWKGKQAVLVMDSLPWQFARILSLKASLYATRDPCHPQPCTLLILLHSKAWQWSSQGICMEQRKIQQSPKSPSMLHMGWQHLGHAKVFAISAFPLPSPSTITCRGRSPPRHTAHGEPGASQGHHGSPHHCPPPARGAENGSLQRAAHAEAVRIP